MKSDDQAPEETPPTPAWEYREEFKINRHMREMVQLTQKVVETEVERLRRQLDKLTYGS